MHDIVYDTSLSLYIPNVPLLQSHGSCKIAMEPIFNARSFSILSLFKLAYLQLSGWWKSYRTPFVCAARISCIMLLTLGSVGNLLICAYPRALRLLRSELLNVFSVYSQHDFRMYASVCCVPLSLNESPLRQMHYVRMGETIDCLN